MSSHPEENITGAAAHKLAKEFAEKHTFDISAKTGDESKVGAATLNKAVQQACGDNKSIFSLVIMHSEVATNLENLKLLKYMTYTDPRIHTGSGDKTLLVSGGIGGGDVGAAVVVLGGGTVYPSEIGDTGVVICLPKRALKSILSKAFSRGQAET